MLVTEQHLLGQCSPFVVYVTRVSLPIEEQMASVCRQVEATAATTSASLQLISPGDSQQPLANQSGQHDLSC